MTGYDEAVEWLRVNAPDWTLAKAESVRVDDTEKRVQVELVLRDPAIYLATGQTFVTLIGEGISLRDACQVAVGGVKSA